MCGETGLCLEESHVCVEGEIRDVVGEKMLYGGVFV